MLSNKSGPLVKFFFIGILLFFLLRNPCKNLKSYKKPFYGFNNVTKKRKEKKRKEKLPKIVVTTFAAANCLHSDRSDQLKAIMILKCSLVPMGVLASRSAHARY